MSKLNTSLVLTIMLLVLSIPAEAQPAKKVFPDWFALRLPSFSNAA